MKINSKKLGWRSIFVIHITLLLALSISSGCTDRITKAEPAVMQVTPELYIFSQPVVGEYESLTITISNTGQSDLLIQQYILDDPTHEFSLEAADADVISPGAQTTCEVRYLPVDKIGDQALLTIYSNGGNKSIELSSLSQSPILQVTPPSVDFGGVTRGPSEVEVTLINIGSGNLIISKISLTPQTSPDIRLGPLNTPLTLNSAEPSSLTLTYTPEDFNSDTGILIIESNADNADDGIISVPIMGRQPAPHLIVSEDRVDFGAVDIGGLSERELTLSNMGDMALTITALEKDPQNGEFTINNLPTTPLDILAGDSIVLSLAYSPENYTLDSIFLIIVSNDPRSEEYPVELRGMVSAPMIQVSPEGLHFDLSTSREFEKDLLIRNVGNQTLEIHDFVLDPPNDPFVVVEDPEFPPTLSPSRPGILEPGEYYVAVIGYAPSVVGEYTGQLRIHSNALSTQELIVELTGRGEAGPEIQVIPRSIHFDTTNPEGNQPLLIRNIGTRDLLVYDLTFENQSTPFYLEPHPDFTPTQEPPAPGSLSPGEAVVLNMGCEPLLGIQQDRLLIHSNDQITSEAIVNLQATGIESCELDILPEFYDFGQKFAECPPAQTGITIYSTCEAHFTITGLRSEGQCQNFSISAPSFPLEITQNDPLEINISYLPQDAQSDDECELIADVIPVHPTPISTMLLGSGGDINQTDTFFLGSGVDILFVVDNSLSMRAEQENLIRNFEAFISFAMEWETDFHIGVITTQADWEYQGRNPGELFGDIRWVDSTTPDLEVQFGLNANVGVDGIGQEAGFRTAEIALTAPLITTFDSSSCDPCPEPYQCIDGSCGGYNHGFLRDEASLEIIFISDEDDYSPDTVEYYLDVFGHVKLLNNMFRASAIVGPPTDCPGVEPGIRYLTMAQITGGKIGSICDDEFAESLRNIAENAFDLNHLRLTDLPVPETIEVQVNGVVNSDWNYLSEENAIVFPEDLTPPSSSEVIVNYRLSCN